MTTTPAPAEDQGTGGQARLGLVLQVAGIVGIVVSVALLIGLWLAQAWAANEVNQLVGSIDDRLVRASTTATLASDRVDTVASGVAEAAAEAGELAATQAASSERLLALSGRIGAVADRYRELRASYGELRESAMSVIDTLQRVERFVPGLAVPQEPIDALVAVDAKLTEIDAGVSSLLAPLEQLGTGAVVAEKLNVAGEAVSSAIGGLSDAIGRVSDRIEALRADVRALGDRMTSALLLVALGGTAIIVYVALLNVALWSLGRRWRREAGA